MEINQLEALEKIYYTAENGLVICNDNPQTAHISEWYHIEDKAKKLDVNAVLFRRYYDDNDKIINSKPVVYIFNDETLFNDETKLAKLHAKLWSAGDIDTYAILGKTNIDIIDFYNARRPAENIDGKLSTKRLKLVSEALKGFNDYRFSAHIFGKGLFWEQGDFEDRQKKSFFDNQLKEENTPFYQLLDYLLETRKYLHSQEKNLEPEIIDKLIIVCLIIKFLEGIKDDNSKNTLRAIYQKLKINSLEEALHKDNTTFIKILDELANEFNGQIFTIFSEEDKKQIQKSNLNLLSQFLKAELNIKTKQIFIWKQYDFNYLPIELISSIYENFLPKQKGVVYTPPFLVNFLIDEVMPLDKPQLFENELFKILDPSCGSGIFLVAAYKRMLQWWIINNSKDKKIKLPNKETCQKILKDNIFGVDIQKTATLITIFSLTITLLDRLSPKEIWNGLKFNDLRDNIKGQDFFEWASYQEKANFSLTIGNPPFNGENNQSSVKIADELINKIGFKHKKVPGNKFALQFFEASMALSQKTCLIIPSNNLLYTNSEIAHKYRKAIFTNFTVEKIFDFTHLRRELFGSADTAVCAIIAQNKPSEQQNIEHTIIKRITSTEKKTAFEIDHYDRHFVRLDWAIDETKQFVWKTNLLGGGRLFHLIYRLSELQNLNKFLSERTKRKKNKWEFGIGYIVEHKNKPKVKADFITNKLTIKPNSFKENGDFIKVIEKSETFVEIRNKELYEFPHIVFKLTVENSKIPMAFIEDHICFNSSFVGISAPPDEREELFQIYQRLFKNEVLSNLYRAFILATTTKALIYHETSITKDDIDNLPYPEDTKYLEPSYTESILVKDILKYYRHLGKSIDKDARELNQIVTSNQLKNYGREFCKVVNSVYEDKDQQGNIIQAYQIGKVEQTPNFTFYQFIYGAIKSENESFNFKTVDFSELDNIFKSLIENKEENRSAIYNRVVRLYDYLDGYDCVFFVKPNAMRYWLDSIALRDADDTIYDYYKAGF